VIIQRGPLGDINEAFWAMKAAEAVRTIRLFD